MVRTCLFSISHYHSLGWPWTSLSKIQGSALNLFERTRKGVGGVPFGFDFNFEFPTKKWVVLS